MFRSALRFSIRDVLWLTVVVALAVGWWVDRGRLWRESDHNRQTVEKLKDVFDVDADALLEGIPPGATSITFQLKSRGSPRTVTIRRPNPDSYRDPLDAPQAPPPRPSNPLNRERDVSERRGLFPK